MLCVDTVTVTCDRCGRPGWRLVIRAGQVFIDGSRINGADGSPYWDSVLRGRRAHRYRTSPRFRPGAFILPADDPDGPVTSREKLVCIGRRHPRYERVVTWASAERSYHAAVAAGRASIGLGEIR
jgi:hypothetical protein